VNSARSVTKNDLSLLSKLVFESFVTQEVECVGFHFVLRTLTTNERENVFRKYRYLSNRYNLFLVLDILSYSIVYIDGNDFIREEHKDFLKNINSKIILFLFYEYQKIDEMVTESSKFIDYFLETRESRNMWLVFKSCCRTGLFEIKKLNQYQYYWIIVNCFKDSSDKEKKEWSKVEYMTNSICAFVNPKGFRSAKHKGIVEQLEENEDKEKQKIIEELESGHKVDESYYDPNDVFASMNRQEGETEEEHEARVNILMEKRLKGEVVDEYDDIIRKDEIAHLKKFLREKRVQVLVDREVRKRNGQKFDQLEVLENESIKIQIEEEKKKGFYHDDFSFLEIVRMKDFSAIPKKEKEVAFKEAMEEQINIDIEVEHFLKSLSKQDTKDTIANNELSTIGNKNSNTSGSQTDSSNDLTRKDILKTAAEKASNMNIDISDIDLIKQRQEKNKRTERALNARNQTKPQEDIDIMRFD